MSRGAVCREANNGSVSSLSLILTCNYLGHLENWIWQVKYGNKQICLPSFEGKTRQFVPWRDQTTCLTHRVIDARQRLPQKLHVLLTYLQLIVDHSFEWDQTQKLQKRLWRQQEGRQRSLKLFFNNISMKDKLENIDSSAENYVVEVFWAAKEALQPVSITFYVNRAFDSVLLGINHQKIQDKICHRSRHYVQFT